MAGGRPTGIRLIIAYKVAKSVVEVAAAAALIAWASPRHIASVRHVVEVLDAHVTARWSSTVARLLALATAPRGLHLVAAASALDGVLSFVEGYSLWRGYRWAPWLVVIATATPLPLEIDELTRRFAAGRLVLMAINVVVVWYLARRIVRRRREGRAHSTARRGDLLERQG